MEGVEIQEKQNGETYGHFAGSLLMLSSLVQ
jgi:hypothetical protein